MEIEDRAPKGVGAASSGAEGATAPAQTGQAGRGMAGATALVAGFFLLSRLTGLAREMVISAQFGTSADLDAYLAAFRVPDLLFQMVAGGALGSAFIPMFAEQWTKMGQARAWQLFSHVFNLVLWATVLLGGVAALFALPLVQYIIAPGFSPAQQMLTADLMRWMMVSTVIFAVSGLIMGTLNALHHFLLPAAAPVLYNLLIIAGAAWLAPDYGPYGLVAGVVAGSVAHLGIQLPALWRKGAHYSWRFSPRVSLADEGVRRVLLLMGPRVLGIFFVQMHFLVNTVLASGLDAGSLAALNFAWLLMLLPLGLFAQSIATVAFPALSAQIAAGDWDGMAAALGRILRIILFATVPAAIVLYVLRVPIITAVFERREFGPESTQLVAFALQFYALGLVAHAVVEITVRAFYAMHNTWTPVAVGVGAMILNIGLSLWWVQSLSFGGLALANTAATSIEMVLLLWLARRRLGVGMTNGLVDSAARTLGAGAIMGIGLWWSLRWAAHMPWRASGLASIIDSGLGLGLAVGLFLAAAALLRSKELSPALALIMRRRR